MSLARALVTEPKILLADEPTGDLDGKTAEAVFGLIQRLHEAHGLTSVLVTHNLEFAERCDRVLRLREGRLVDARARIGVDREWSRQALDLGADFKSSILLRLRFGRQGIGGRVHLVWCGFCTAASKRVLS